MRLLFLVFLTFLLCGISPQKFQHLTEIKHLPQVWREIPAINSNGKSLGIKVLSVGCGSGEELPRIKDFFLNKLKYSQVTVTGVYQAVMSRATLLIRSEPSCANIRKRGRGLRRGWTSLFSRTDFKINRRISAIASSV